MSARANPFFSPTQISGCQLWLDAADSSIVTLTGGTITQLRDKSTNAYTFSNANGFTYNQTKFQGLYPSFYNASSVTGRNLGSNVSISLTQPFTFFTVCSILDTVSGGYIFDSTNAANRAAFTAYLNGRPVMFAGLELSNTQSNAFVSPAMHSGIFNTTSSFMYLNGTENVSGSAGTQNASGITIGARYTNEQPWTGHICEVVLYSGALPRSQRQQVEGYLAWKWGLQGSLPANHPYKSSPIPPLLNPPVSLPSLTQNTQGFLPTQVQGCQLWYDGADPLGTGVIPANGASVSTWVDKSGQGNSATASVAGTYTTTSRAVTFNNSFYTTPYPANPINETGFYVFLTTSSGGPQMLLGANSGGREIAIYNNGNQFGVINSLTAWGAITAGGTITSNRIYLATSRISGGTSTSIALNGALSFIGPVTVPAFTAGVLTSLGREAGSSFPFLGNLHEIVVFNSVLSDSQQQQVEGYLAWKWGIQTFLPAAHPYKSFPPFLPAAAFPPRSLGATGIWTPTRISGCQIWLDGTDPLGTGASLASGTPIPRWVNKGTSSLTLSNAGGFPTSFLNAQNRRGTVSFSGAYYDGSFTFSLATKSVFLICSQSNSSLDSPQGILSFIGAGNDTVASTDGFGYQATQDGFGSFGWLYNIFQSGVGAPSPSTGYYITFGVPGNPTPFGMYASVLSNQYEQAFVNGSNTSNFTITTTPGTSTTLRIGARMIGGALRGQLYGTIGEILIYNIGLSSNQRYQVEGYLAWKWGLQGSLPANHPFKLWPPPP